jgi:hypothetical protein
MLGRFLGKINANIKDNIVNKITAHNELSCQESTTVTGGECNCICYKVYYKPGHYEEHLRYLDTSSPLNLLIHDSSESFLSSADGMGRVGYPQGIKSNSEICKGVCDLNRLDFLGCD